MSPAEVYRSLGIARQSLYDRIAEGTLTTVYFSGDLRLVRAEIDAWRVQRAQRRQTKKTAKHE
jgi:predicted DNA-binding transcriptional regulator AlpA